MLRRAIFLESSESSEADAMLPGTKEKPESLNSCPPLAVLSSCPPPTLCCFSNRLACKKNTNWIAFLASSNPPLCLRTLGRMIRRMAIRRLRANSSWRRGSQNGRGQDEQG